MNYLFLAGILAGVQGVPTDPLFSNVMVVHEFETPADLSPTPRAVTLRTGGAGSSVWPDITKRKFGLNSAYFNGNGTAAIRVGGLASASSVSDFGTGDWTIEFWFAKSAEPSGTLYCYGSWRTSGDHRSVRIGYNPTTNVFFVEVSPTGTSTTVTGSFDCDTDGVSVATLFDGNFHHIVAQRTTTNLDIYIDGNRGATRGAMSTNPVYYPSGVPAYPINIGTISSSTAGITPDNGILDFWMDEIRVSKGLARYSGASFSPPTARFGRNSGEDANFSTVIALLDFEGYWGPIYEGNQISVTGGRHSLGSSNEEDWYQDGIAITTSLSGQLVYQDTASPDWGLGSGDFCIEIFGSKGSFSTGRTWVGNYGLTDGQRGWSVMTGGSGNSFVLQYSTDGNSGTVATQGCGSLASVPPFNVATLDSATAYDLCIERGGTDLRFYVNGTLVRTITSFSATIFNPGASNDFLSILSKTNASGNRQDAWIGECKAVRVTKQTRYGAANYTVPLLPLPKQ